MEEITLQRLETISNNETLQEDFIINLNDQIASDEEVARRKVAQLKEAYEQDPELTDNILMTLCGYTMETLVNQALGIDESK